MPSPLSERKGKETYIEDEEDNAHSLAQHIMRPSEHGLIVGMTGGGKSYFAVNGILNHFRENWPFIPRYIVDSTADDDFKASVPDAYYFISNSAPKLHFDRKRTLIWQPLNSKVPEAYAEFCENLNDSRLPFICIADEVKSFTKGGLDALETLMKQARKHGGTVIVLTQAIGRVDVDLFRQMTHFFQFVINEEPYDLARARAYLQIGKAEYHQPSGEYGFWYRRTRGSRHPAREFKDMQEFFSRLKTSH